MHIIRAIFNEFTKKERKAVFSFCVIFCVSLVGWVTVFLWNRTAIIPVAGGSWQEGIASQPTSPNPILASNEADQAISMLVFAPISELADDIKEEAGGKSYIVTLKENLLWSDKKPLTSDDVVFTIESIQNPSIHSPLFKDWQGIAVERLSELQIKFTLPTTYVFFEESLKNLRPAPKHAFLEEAPKAPGIFSDTNVVGSGPYIVKRINKNGDGTVSNYQFSTNENYTGKQAFIKKFSLIFYKNEEELVRAFQMRRIDGFGTTLPFSDSSFLSRGKTETIPMNRYYAVFFNGTKNKALQNKNVRYALDRATPKNEIREKIFSGKAFLINGPVLDEKNESAEDSYNIETARELLKQSGEKKIKIVLTVPNIPFLVQTAEIIKTSWENAGVDSVSLQIQEPDVIFNSTIQTGNYEAILFGNILENKSDLFSFWHSSQRGYPGLNLSLFSKQSADEILEEIRTIKDSETTRVKLMSLDAIIAGESPAVFLYSLPYFYTHNAKLQGIEAIEKAKSISSPADRFAHVENWYIFHARVVQ